MWDSHFWLSAVSIPRNATLAPVIPNPPYFGGVRNLLSPGRHLRFLHPDAFAGPNAPNSNRVCCAVPSLMFLSGCGVVYSINWPEYLHRA